MVIVFRMIKVGHLMRPQDVRRPRHMVHLAEDSRGYPIIPTIGRGETHADFGSINERRKLALATFDWCSVCGLPFNGESRWQVAPGEDWKDRQFEGAWLCNEAPAHEICLIYAAHVCPHLSSPGHRLGDEYRHGQQREGKINLVGFRRTTDVLALQSGLQDDLHVLHFKQSELVGEVSYSQPEELADRYASLLKAEVVPVLSEAETGLIGLFNELSDMGDTVAGAALMAGGIFLPNIRKVQGMEIFLESALYQSLALHFLDLQKLAHFAEGNEDPASRFVSAWVLERHNQLPGVLANWRHAGVKIAKAHGLTPSRTGAKGSRRTVSKNVPCPCGSGRKAGRCHPSGLPSER